MSKSTPQLRRSARDIYPRDQLVIREVGLRDGLQLVKTPPPTIDKKAWIQADYNAGIRHFEVGSYLPVDKFPQFADVDVIADGVAELDGAWSTALILNKRGALSAFDGSSHELMCVVSVSEEHNLANARRTRAQTLGEIGEIFEMARARPNAPVVGAALAMAFGCSIAGKSAIREVDVLNMAEQALDLGAEVLNVADTVGYAAPNEVSSLVKQLLSMLGDVPLCIHIHDTRGLGVANVAAAIDAGVRIVDASIGGLGGCPFAPNATGNVVLEDVAFLAKAMGITDRYDVSALSKSRAIVERSMPEEQLHGGVIRAGLPRP